MKNTLTDMNNYLFEQLERLMDDELTDEQFEKEVRRSEAVVNVAEKVIENAELSLKVMKHVDEYRGGNGEFLPPMLEAKHG